LGTAVAMPIGLDIPICDKQNTFVAGTKVAACWSHLVQNESTSTYGVAKPATHGRNRAIIPKFFSKTF